MRETFSKWITVTLCNFLCSLGNKDSTEHQWISSVKKSDIKNRKPKWLSTSKNFNENMKKEAHVHRKTYSVVPNERSNNSYDNIDQTFDVKKNDMFSNRRSFKNDTTFLQGMNDSFSDNSDNLDSSIPLNSSLNSLDNSISSEMSSSYTTIQVNDERPAPLLVNKKTEKYLVSPISSKFHKGNLKNQFEFDEIKKDNIYPKLEYDKNTTTHQSLSPLSNKTKLDINISNSSKLLPKKTVQYLTKNTSFPNPRHNTGHNYTRHNILTSNPSHAISSNDTLSNVNYNSSITLTNSSTTNETTDESKRRSFVNENIIHNVVSENYDGNPENVFGKAITSDDNEGDEDDKDDGKNIEATVREIQSDNPMFSENNIPESDINLSESMINPTESANSLADSAINPSYGMSNIDSMSYMQQPSSSITEDDNHDLLISSKPKLVDQTDLNLNYANNFLNPTESENEQQEHVIPTGEIQHVQATFSPLVKGEIAQDSVFVDSNALVQNLGPSGNNVIVQNQVSQGNTQNAEARVNTPGNYVAAASNDGSVTKGSTTVSNFKPNEIHNIDNQVKIIEQPNSPKEIHIAEPVTNANHHMLTDGQKPIKPVEFAPIHSQPTVKLQVNIPEQSQNGNLNSVDVLKPVKSVQSVPVSIQTGGKLKFPIQTIASSSNVNAVEVSAPDNYLEVASKKGQTEDHLNVDIKEDVLNKINENYLSKTDDVKNDDIVNMVYENSKEGDENAIPDFIKMSKDQSPPNHMSTENINNGYTLSWRNPESTAVDLEAMGIDRSFISNATRKNVISQKFHLPKNKTFHAKKANRTMELKIENATENHDEQRYSQTNETTLNSRKQNITQVSQDNYNIIKEEKNVKKEKIPSSKSEEELEELVAVIRLDNNQPQKRSQESINHDNILLKYANQYKKSHRVVADFSQGNSNARLLVYQAPRSKKIIKNSFEISKRNQIEKKYLLHSEHAKQEKGRKRMIGRE